MSQRAVTVPPAAAGDPAPAPNPRHQPVLLAEAVAALGPGPGGRYVDGTFGGGGHTRAILAASAPDGRVLAIDADPEAIARARALAAEPAVGDRLLPVQGNFADLGDIVREAEFGPVDGILLDLGLSSYQLDTPERGFAFRHDAPLDMRFDPGRGQPAADLVNALPEAALADLLWRYGEERQSRRIARAVAAEREREPIATTGRLAAIVEQAVGGRRGAAIHPATRTFQALRIATNDELGALLQGLGAAVEALAPGGKLVVIAFHSLEDRILKRFLDHECATCLCPPEAPLCVCGHQPRLSRVRRGVVKPAPEELAANPRSRSAVMRVATRLAPTVTPPGPAR